MLFHSTRGKDKDRDFSSILMQGLADDGGLFMPNYWPQVDLNEIKFFMKNIDLMYLYYLKKPFLLKLTMYWSMKWEIFLIFL